MHADSSTTNNRSIGGGNTKSEVIGNHVIKSSYMGGLTLSLLLFITKCKQKNS